MSEIINFYETSLVKKHLKDKYQMGGIDHHHIQFPKHLLVCSGTGGGKSNLIMNYISQTSKCASNCPKQNNKCNSDKCGTFGHISIVCKMNEPIYDALKEALGDKLTVYTKPSEFPTLDRLPHQGVQQLVIFDDCIADKDQSKYEQYFLQARKVGAGVQCVYLTQSYFKTPKFIRLQCSYLLFLTVTSDNEIGRIMSNYTAGTDLSVVKKIFKNAVKKKLNFFKIDVSNPNPNTKYSRNWGDFYTIVDEEGEPLEANEIELFY